MKLYELVGAYKDVQELLEEGHDVQDTFESIQSTLEEKVESICQIKLNLDAQVEAIKAEEKRLAERRKSLESQVERLVDYLTNQLSEANIQQMVAGIHDVRFAKCPPSVEVLDESLIPNEFITEEVVRKVDKRLILSRLKDGEQIQGVQLVSDKTKLRFK